MFIAALIVCLYFLPDFVRAGNLGKALIISDWGAILAAATFSVGFVLYLWAPRERILPSSLAVYLSLAVTTGVLVATTGGAHSSFIALWIVIAVFASVFGLWGLGSLLVAVVSYAVYTFVAVGDTSAGVVVTLAGIAPLVASYIIFHTRAKVRAKDDAAYYALADELSQVTNKSDAVIRAIGDGVIAIDDKGVIELMNPSASRIIGWGNSDAVGLDYKSVLKLSDKDDKPLTKANDPIVQVLATNKDVHTKDFYVTTGGGKRLLLSLVASPIGQLGEGAIIVFRDITKEQAEEREQAEFISTASHEMRTPVASIEGYLGLALNPNTAQVDAKAREFIEKAQDSARHLGRLFQDLLDVSKAEDGRLSNHPAVVDIVSYVGTIVETFKPKADEKNLRLFYKPQPDGEAVEDRNISPVFYANVDQDHLREVVSNLLENAVKYTLKGDVIVDIGGDDDHVQISIKDSGIGIPHEDLPHLFQKFYRVDNSTTREIGGTGLGLYLCRRLSEVMGGRIWVESEFGKGSTFYLEIPRLEREEAMRMLDAASTEISPEQIVGSSQPIPLPLDSEDEAAFDPMIASEAVEPTPAATTQSLPQIPLPPQQPAQPQPPQPTSQPSPTLETIEQNPSQYTAGRPEASIKVPVRKPEENNQT